MLPRIEIGRAQVPGGGGELRLIRRGSEFSIMLGSNELMNSRISASEKALADLACDRIAGRERARLLIGGFGMGFTLRAALAKLGPRAEVVVAELVPAVVAWARGPMAELSGKSLADPRVTIVEGDVAELIAGARSEFDAILLDVDNGPDGLTRAGNDRLYSAEGLGLAKAALRPGGILGIWSAAPDKVFAQRLSRAGYAVEEVVLRAKASGKGLRHILWFARGP
jgi:spermidine synthase